MRIFTNRSFKRLTKITQSTILISASLMLAASPVASASAKSHRHNTAVAPSTSISQANSGLNFASSRLVSQKEADFQKLSKDLFDPNNKLPKFATDHVVVQFKSSGYSQRITVANKYGSKLLGRIDNTRAFTAKVPSGSSVAQLTKQLSKDTNVAYAEPDYKAVALGQQTSWGYDFVNAAAAHTSNGKTGSGVTVAIVDTGIDYEHPDLSANIWTNPSPDAGNCTQPCFPNDTHGWDFIGATGGQTGIPQPDNDPMDGNDHGTHVAGIVAAEDNSIGTVGVAPDATLMPVKVLDDAGFGLDSTISAGIHYAVDHGADIINMSLGGPVASRAMSDAVKYATDHNVAVAVAAGNDFGFNAYADYPAAYPGVISVGALDQNGNKAWFSNWGSVDVMAPGDNIISTIPDDRYASFSGTSMASPFVAGELALIKQAHSGYSADQLRQVLQTTSSNMYKSGQDYLTGSGSINAQAASGTLARSVNLTSSAFRIVANNDAFTDGSSTLTGRFMNADGTPDVGETVNFSTTKGHLSTSSTTTDGSGLATTILTADNQSGLATVTADAGSFGSAKIQVILLNDKVNVSDIQASTTSVDSAQFSAGQSVTFLPTLRDNSLIYLDTYNGRKANLSWQILDSHSNPVSGTSGSKSNVSVIFSAQPAINITLPTDLADGNYSFQLTATDADSGKTSSGTYKFNVGGSHNILVIPGFCDAYSDPYLLDTSIAVCGPPIMPVTTALDTLGKNYDVWAGGGSPDLSVMEQYPLVIFAGMGQPNSSVVNDYLNAGGNAFVSGGTDFVSENIAPQYEGQADNSFGGDGWCAGTPLTYSVSYLGFSCPDPGVETQPTNLGTITGTSGGVFGGMSFNIDPFDLNGDGAKDNFYSDRFHVNAGATAAIDYQGGQKGGLTKDDGTSRLVLVGFGIEGINDNLGANSRSDVLDAAMNFLKPSSVSVTSVTPDSVTRGEAKDITITGSGFETTGASTVRLGGVRLGHVRVLDRNTMTARIPASYPNAGPQDLMVTNPFGQSDTLGDAVNFKYAKPVVNSVSPGLASNNKNRSVVIKGFNFHTGAAVSFNGTSLSVASLNSKRIEVTVPASFPVGTYDVKVTNVDGRFGTKSNAYKSRFGFTYKLHFGMTDSAVRYLEKRLYAGGYFSGHVDDYYGGATVRAVKLYQKAHHLSASGVLNSQTRDYLNRH